jgi:hypothetical protein
MRVSRWIIPPAAVAAVIAGSRAFAGVVNPDISVIGQPFATLTDGRGAPDRNRLRLDAGETEFVFDAYLNPYARGTFVAALGAEGIGLEEGHFTIQRGLPAGLSVRGGKYRAGFGVLNPQHPHLYPFAERFGVMAAYLPGDESLNETGVSVSGRIPAPGEFSLTATGDWLQGDTYRITREPSGSAEDPLLSESGDRDGESRPAFLGRIAGFTMIGEQSALGFGVSATEGTNNVAAGTRTTVFGADVKAKLWTSPRSYIVIQAEALRAARESATWSEESGYAHDTFEPAGGYIFGDYNFSPRYNAGASYERYQLPEAGEPWNQAAGLFAGYSLMEETTAIRLDWRREIPDAGDAVNTFTLRVIYSMGPHKAHQF